MSGQIGRSKGFVGQQRKPFGGAGVPRRKSIGENGKPVNDLRTILAKKQSVNITDLRAKLKPKALYTSKLSSRAQQQQQHQQQRQHQAAENGRGPRGPGAGRQPLKLTATFKNSVSSAVSGSSSKPSSRERTRSAPVSHRSRSTSSKLPSYEEAKKISVTVPGLSRPLSEVRVGVE
jgi:hypothetical protein